jgi:hypothetical protein
MDTSKHMGRILSGSMALLEYQRISRENSPLGERREAFAGSNSDESISCLFTRAISGVLAISLLFYK